MRDKSIWKILAVLIVLVMVTSCITLCIAAVDDSTDNTKYLNKIDLYRTFEDRIITVNNISCLSSSSSDVVATSGGIKLYLSDYLRDLSEPPYPALIEGKRYIYEDRDYWTWGDYFLNGHINGTSYSYRLYLASASSTTFKIEIIINRTTVATFPLLTVPYDPDYQPFSGQITGLVPTTSSGDEVILKITKISGDAGSILFGGTASYITIPPLKRPIQAKIDAAKPGDTIIIGDGIYKENVNVNKRLTIRSENRTDKTIIQAANPYDHIFEVTAEYVNISGFTIKGATKYEKAGIYLNSTNYCNISNNNCTNTGYGICLSNSSNNKLTGNIMLENGIVIWGHSLSDYTHEIDESNILNGKPVYYWKDFKGRRIPDGAGQVILVNCTNVVIENQSLNKGSVGIKVVFSSNITILNNNCSNNRDEGIYLYESNNNSIINNNCSNSGIYLCYSNENSISNNNCSNIYKYGIYFDSSNNNNISNNNCSNNWYGIYFDSSNNNKIYCNNFIKNSISGVIFHSSIENNIYCNNFIKSNANMHGGYNCFFNSPSRITYTYNGNTYTKSLGNYWSYYTGSDADGDGIGDTSYRISNGPSDRHPLIVPFENYFAQIKKCCEKPVETL